VAPVPPVPPGTWAQVAVLIPTSATKPKHFIAQFQVFMFFSFGSLAAIRSSAINLASYSACKSGNLEEYAPYVDFNDSSGWKRLLVATNII
jgi:hypothetical protein